MAGFTLIHGSAQNSAGWELVARILRDEGHEVSTPDLPKSEPGWTLVDYAKYIAERIAQSRPHVIAATSFGGVFLPLVADHADALLYIAAAVPEPGRSVRDQFTDDPSMFAPGWVEVGRRWFDESQREVLAREFLFHDCDEARAAWALPTVETFHTQHLVTEASPMTAWPSIPAVSIVCTHDRTITPGWQQRTSERLGMKTVILDAGHCPHVSQPEAVASIASAIIRPVS